MAEGDPEGDVEAHAEDRRVDQLVEAGAWPDLARTLLAWGADHEREADLEDALLGLLRVGRLRGLSDAVRELEPDEERLPLALRLFCLDCDTRFNDTPAERLQLAFDALDREEVRPDLRLWLSAISAEFHLWRGQLIGLYVAQVAMTAPLDVETSWTRLGRGRLRRLLALASLLAEGENGPNPRDLVADVVGEFDAIGAEEEAVATRCLIYGISTAYATDAQVEESVAELRRCCEAGEALKSDRVALAWFCYGWTAAMIWDFDAVDEATTVIERGRDTIWPFLAHLVDLLVIVRDLRLDGVSPALLERLETVLREWNDQFSNTPALSLYVARLLLNDGLWGPAERIMETTDRSGFVFSATTRLTIREVTSRVELLRTRGQPALQQLRSVIDEWATMGQPYAAAHLALCAARDCERAGLLDDAAELRARGLVDMPPGAARARREWDLLQPAAPAGDAPPTNRVLVIGPDVRVERDGEAVALSGLQAKLLALLVIARRPCSVDWLVESLWPDVSVATGRGRLKVHLYRLRQQVGVDQHELVRRDGRGLSLDSGGWSVDLWEFERLVASSDAEDHRRAIEQYDVEIADSQLAFDDDFQMARARHRVTWSSCARRVLEQGVLSPARVAERVLDVGADDPGLLELLTAALRKEGDEARAELVRGRLYGD